MVTRERHWVNGLSLKMTRMMMMITVARAAIHKAKISATHDSSEIRLSSKYFGRSMFLSFTFCFLAEQIPEWACLIDVK